LLTEFRRTPETQNGERQWIATAYLPPSTATPELRRGPGVYLETERTTQIAPNPNTWRVSTRASVGLGSPNDAPAILSWAQVALPGRLFDDIRSESDENLPLTIRGQIIDADLVSSVRFVRSRPAFPEPRPGLIVPTPGPVRGILAPAFLNPSLPAVRLSLERSNHGCLWSVLLQRRWNEALQHRDNEWLVESIERGGGCN
jgi:hypothetical protein